MLQTGGKNNVSLVLRVAFLCFHRFMQMCLQKNNLFLCCSAKITHFPPKHRAESVSCRDWLRCFMCVRLCLKCVFLPASGVLLHTPHPAEEPFGEDRAPHEYEWGGNTLGRPGESDDCAGKDQSIYGDVWLHSPATDMIKWLNFNVCVFASECVPSDLYE